MRFYLTVRTSLVRYSLNNNGKFVRLVWHKKDNAQSSMIKVTILTILWNKKFHQWINEFTVFCILRAHWAFVNENHHNSEFISAPIIIHVVIFISLILSGVVRAITRAILPDINYALRWSISHLYEFDKRDWKYICHVASL